MSKKDIHELAEQDAKHEALQLVIEEIEHLLNYIEFQYDDPNVLKYAKEIQAGLVDCALYIGRPGNPFLMSKNMIQCQDIAQGLRSFGAEHGRPNGVYSEELARDHCNMDRRTINRLGRNPHAIAEIWMRLGGPQWGQCPRYTRGKWYI